MFENLLSLATSHYSNVRIKGQDALFRCMNNFSHSYKQLIPRLVASLQKDEAISHEEFKGALYVLLGLKNKTILTKHDWHTLEQVTINWNLWYLEYLFVCYLDMASLNWSTAQ